MKPGWTTTEFYVTIFSQAIAVLGFFHPGIDVQHWTPIVQAAALVASAAGAAFYAHSRAVVKAAASTSSRSTP